MFVRVVSARLGGQKSPTLRYVIRIYKRKVKTANVKNGTHFGYLYIWDQFWAYSARVEVVEHAAA